MTSAPTLKADGTVLTGVSETALLTLRVRANEARRPDSIIDDPMAIELTDAIDYDFAKFGFSRRQDMALRALAYDRTTRSYLLDHPEATVVALAEGLQVRRCEEPGRIAAIVEDGGVPAEITVDDQDTWPWTLLSIVPAAAQAAWSVPAVIVFDFERA